jgi:hypothetical protein
MRAGMPRAIERQNGGHGKRCAAIRGYVVKFSRVGPGMLQIRDTARFRTVRCRTHMLSREVRVLMRCAPFTTGLAGPLWFAILTLTATCAGAGPVGVGPAGAGSAEGVGLAIVDFSYSDSSGEVTDQAGPHRERLQAFMGALRRDYLGDRRYRLVPASCRSACLDDEDPELGEVERIAKADGARLLVVGGIHKMSTLVQWARVRVIDLTTERAVIDRLFTFRGDTDEAWTRAESFVSREINSLLTPFAAGASAPAASAPAANAPAAVAPALIRLAVFDFELQDFSAGAVATNTTSDVARLREISSEARKLLSQSGRYSLVDVDGAEESAARTHTLRSCDGCEAAIAERLGADQSLIGVVNRISRTEYTVKFQIRDAHTGAILRDEDSGLRMGADYSWGRGALQLIADRVLRER